MSFGGMSGAEFGFKVDLGFNIAPAQQGITQMGQVMQNFTASVSGQMNVIGRSIASNFGQGKMAVNEFGGSLTGLANQWAVIGTGIAAVKELGKAFQDASKEADRLGKGSLDFLANLRDIQAATTGKPGAIDPAIVQQQIQLMQMGLTARQAHEAAETFRGEAAIAVDQKRISQETADQILAKTAGYAQAMGGKEDEFVKLAGFLTRMRGAGATPEGITTEAGELMRIIGFAPGKSTAMLPQLMQFMIQNTGGKGAQIDDPRAAASIIMGVGMGTSQGRVGTAANQISDALLGLTRGSSKFAEWAQKEAGVTQDMDTYAKLKRVIPRLRKEIGLSDEQLFEAVKDIEAGGEGGEHGQRIMNVLGAKGLKQAPARRGLAAMVANWPMIQQMYESTEGRVTPATVAEGMRKYQETDVARSLRAEGGAAAAQIQLGMEYAERNIFTKQAIASLTRQRKLTPETMADQHMLDFLSGTGITGRMTAKERMIATETVRQAQQEYGADFQFGAAGTITQREIEQGWMSGELNQAFNRAKQRRADRGGRRLGGIPKPIDPAVEEATAGGVVTNFANMLPEPPQGGVAMAAGRGLNAAVAPFLPESVNRFLARIADATEGTHRETKGQLPPPAVGHGEVPR